MKKILVVEDEPAISRVLAAYLRNVPYEVELAERGDEALVKFDQFKPALVLLDVMLPGMDGWTVLKHIRSKSACPVIMLTAMGEKKDRLTGFEEGADDYMVKPFEPDEMLARVKAVLRRPAQVVANARISLFGCLRIDHDARQVQVNGVEITILPRDLGLLLFFVEHPNQFFTREQLIERVWGMDYEGSDRAVDLAIKRLRKALADWPETEGEIRTLRGMGYQLYVQT